ncbi:2-succinylbenzoate--CoA ligase [Vibrio hippocampi]|uniref:2-succinylbenzoate--CoA ligase n=2 Tax=Vibrio hippocampi TaxID=654686 RepID=A0ABM8ZK64_9VIBR|nr:2-succinylbenzoate--CoA ligase [Vibrio hippocampi]
MASRCHHAIALQWGSDSISWGQLQTTLNIYRQTAISQGVQKQQVVCLIGKNSPQLLFAYLAILSLGAKPALIAPQPATLLVDKLNILYRREATAYVWDLTSERDVQAEVTALSCRSIQWIKIASDVALINPVPPPSMAASISDVLSTEDAQERLGHLQQEQIASIIFTSGSTGSPKAVAHSVRSHLASAAGILEQIKFNHADSWLLSLPLFHVSGLAIVWRWLYSGAVLRLPSGDFQQDIAEVTHASLVSTQLKRVLDGQWKTRLKTVLLGGSQIPKPLLYACKQQGIDTWMGYGLTEMASTVTVKQIGRDISSGTVIAYRQLKIDDQRIYVAGDTLACGYIKQGQLIPLLADGELWFDTKDLGCWNEQQELLVTGRADNLFISGGENIHCEEIEAVLNRFADITQSIVVPVADEEFGARPIAVIQSQTVPDVVSMNQRLAPHLVKYKHPIAYWLIPEALLSQGIKVSRAEVKRWLAREQSNYVVI